MEEPPSTRFDLPYTRLLDEEAAHEQPFVPPPVLEQRPRQHFLKFFIVLLTAFFCVGLIFAFSKVVEFRGSLSLGKPRDDNVDEVLPRGVAEGVSLKTFRWPVWEMKLPSFPWSPKMLSFERTSFHFQPKKNWMNGIINLSSVSKCEFLKCALTCDCMLDM